MSSIVFDDRVEIKGTCLGRHEHEEENLTFNHVTYDNGFTRLQIETTNPPASMIGDGKWKICLDVPNSGLVNSLIIFLKSDDSIIDIYCPVRNKPIFYYKTYIVKFLNKLMNHKAPFIYGTKNGKPYDTTNRIFKEIIRMNTSTNIKLLAYHPCGNNEAYSLRFIQYEIAHCLDDKDKTTYRIGNIVANNYIVRNILEEFTKSDEILASEIGICSPAQYRFFLMELIDSIWD
jgi:hypothetical protein